MTRYLITTSWIVIIILALMAVFLVRDVLVSALSVGVRVIVYAVAAAVVVLVLYAAWSGWERIMLLRAKRKAIEHDALIKVIEAPHDHTVWTHQVGYGYHSLTMDSRVHVKPGDNRASTNDEVRAWVAYHQLQVPRARSNGVEAPALAAPERPVDIMQALAKIPTALIVGAMGTGKTTLLHHIVDEYSRRGAHTLVLDPHATPNKWRGAERVIGGGRNYPAIEEAIERLLGEMNRRFQEMADGMVREGEHPPIVVVADELIAIVDQCRNARAAIVELLTESRKAALLIYFGSHSQRVRPLGLDGKGDLKDGLAIINLRNEGGQRRATIEMSNGNEIYNTEAVLPGEYRVINDDPARDVLAAALEPPTLEPGGEDARVIQMYLEDASLREITTAVWGKHGAFYNEKVEQILRRYKVEETLR